MSENRFLVALVIVTFYFLVAGSVVGTIALFFFSIPLGLIALFCQCVFWTYIGML